MLGETSWELGPPKSAPKNIQQGQVILNLEIYIEKCHDMSIYKICSKAVKTCVLGCLVHIPGQRERSSRALEFPGTDRVGGLEA